MLLSWDRVSVVTSGKQVLQDEENQCAKRALLTPPASLWVLPHRAWCLGDTACLSSGLCPLTPVSFLPEVLAEDQRAGGWGEGYTALPAPFLLSHRWAEAALPSRKLQGCWWRCPAVTATVTVRLSLSPSLGTTPCPARPFRPKDGPGSPMCPHPLLASLHPAHPRLCKEFLH